MISDNDLYTLAIFLGSLAMLLIVLYHFLEINAPDETDSLLNEKTAASKSGNTSEGNLATAGKSGVR